MTEWRQVSEQLGQYEVSRCGRIRRSDTKREKKTTIAVNGYPVVGLWRGNKGAVCYVHDLVMAAFAGPKAVGTCVNHIDGIKSNSSFENLEYTTQAGNVAHAVAIGLMPRGEKSASAKLTEAQVREIHRRAWAGEPSSTLQRDFGVKAPIISQIKHGTRWRHLGLSYP